MTLELKTEGSAWGGANAAASKEATSETEAVRTSMDTFSSYLFQQVLRPVLAILAGLAAVAVLTQGFNQLDLLMNDRQGVLAFFWVTLLTLPQALSLVLPFAVFVGVTYTLDRMRRESEIAVILAAGVSLRRIAGPIIQLACLVALVHLAVNVLVQPAAFREIRHTLFSVRTELVAGLIREGDFTYPAPGLTLYVRERAPGGQMRNVMIDDARGRQEITYTARLGALSTINGAPTFSMLDGQIQRQRTDGTVDLIEFTRYALPLGLSFREPQAFYLKPSDRYLNELFSPDLTTYYDQGNVAALLSEGHSRLSSPLLDIALALVAVAGVLTGQANRRGYQRQILLAVIIAIVVRLAAVGVQAAAVSNPAFNPLQYALPILTALIASIAIGGRTPRRKRLHIAPAVWRARTA